MSTSPRLSPEQQRKRATIGAFVGTAIEWYDFFIFGTAAALVFGHLFYPAAAPGVGLLASFATFWVGFIARPLGGILFGHLGDRIGRKKVLVVTLFIMGLGTTCIGLLPTYAQIGVAAPILLILLRAVQGLAVGGEWAGATLMATESSQGKKKGMAGAWVQQGSPAGSILATVVFLLVGSLPDDAFMSWGWRVPFLLSAVLVIVGLFIRAKVEESDDFKAVQAKSEVVKVPFVEVFRTAGGTVVLGLIASILGIAAAFFNNTFLLSWTTTPEADGGLGMHRQSIQTVLLLIAVLQFIWQPIAAKIAERTSAVTVMVCGITLNLAAIVPMFLALQTANPVLITLAMSLTTLGGAGYYAMLGAFIASTFRSNVRYTGVALANGLCASLIGGSTPLIAQLVLGAAGPWGVAAFYAVISALTLVGVVGLARKLKRSPIEAEATDPVAVGSR
ncbi:MAG: MHS family MFS transporter [Arthrobacter sp.]|jgi:MFS family permease|nr:MHS family MFS transporter [Arthrobacter sp.]